MNFKTMTAGGVALVLVVALFVFGWMYANTSDTGQQAEMIKLYQWFIAILLGGGAGSLAGGATSTQQLKGGLDNIHDRLTTIESKLP